MNLLSRILTICLCSAPFVNGAWAAVATTAGHNLTAYHPSNTNNNQWASMTNGREDVTTTPVAKADFGNCNAMITRCATPKCANGGCTDMAVASGIVAGCVQMNKACEQYGDSLISYMAAQLVSTSTAKANAQNAAAAAQSNQQMAQMQQQMNMQMAQMQQQMAQQNAQTQQQIRDALEQQAQQNAAALESVTAAATTAATAAAKQTESGVTTTQEQAIENGVSSEILERQKMTGRIMTEIDGADVALEEVKKAMNTAFEYAGCDSRGNNCSGPKRIKKFRELALGFIEPYDSVADKIDDALDDAQLAGIDITPIYMMLNDSCKEWANYLCPRMDGGEVVYDDSGIPFVCGISGKETKRVPVQSKKWVPTDPSSVNLLKNQNISLGSWQDTIEFVDQTVSVRMDEKCRENAKNSAEISNCIRKNCKPCTIHQKLTSHDEIYAGWTDFEADVSKSNNIVTACASGLLKTSSFLGRRVRRKNGVGLINIEDMATWLSMTEPKTIPSINKGSGAEYLYKTCYTDDGLDMKGILQKDSLAKALSKDLCSDQEGKISRVVVEDTCPFVSPIYALCDAHAYNAGKGENSENAAEREEVQEIVALKTTVIAEQMYKQYEYLAATLRRLKTHLEKAVFSADLQAAGAKSEDTTSSTASYTNKEESIYLPGAANCYTGDTDTALNCLQSNLNTVLGSIKSQRKKACQQLVATVDAARDIFSSIPNKEGTVTVTEKCDDINNKCSDESALRKCVNGLTLNISTAKTLVENSRNSYRYNRF